jgi:hypothetical protein
MNEKRSERLQKRSTRVQGQTPARVQDKTHAGNLHACRAAIVAMNSNLIAIRDCAVSFSSTVRKMTPHNFLTV